MRNTPSVLLQRQQLRTGRKQTGSGPVSSVGAEHGHLLVGKQHVGTPCGILAPRRTTRSENNLLGRQIPLFLSDDMELGFKKKNGKILSLGLAFMEI